MLKINKLIASLLQREKESLLKVTLENNNIRLFNNKLNKKFIKNNSNNFNNLLNEDIINKLSNNKKLFKNNKSLWKDNKKLFKD